MLQGLPVLLLFQCAQRRDPPLLSAMPSPGAAVFAIATGIIGASFVLPAFLRWLS